MPESPVPASLTQASKASRHLQPADDTRPLPCPFCGAGAVVDCDASYGFWSVRCRSCRCRTALTRPRTEAVAAWNRRIPPRVDPGA